MKRNTVPQSFDAVESAAVDDCMSSVLPAESQSFNPDTADLTHASPLPPTTGSLNGA